VSEISVPIVEALPTTDTEPPKYIWLWPSTAWLLSTM